MVLVAIGPVLAEDAQEEPTLKSIYAGVHSLDEFCTPDCNAVVLVFLDTECPVARSYIPRLKEIHQRWKDQGVCFLGIFASARVNIWDMAVYAQDQDIPFPVLQDVDLHLADGLEVQTTPESVVLDKKLQKQYQGPIDNQFKRGGNLKAPTQSYLEDAISAVVAGKDVEVARRPTSGCKLMRNEIPVSHEEVTYYRDVAPIIQRNCQACHRKGGVGPFELKTYEDVYYNSQRIAEVVQDRQMPPWHGQLNSEFGELRNDKRLSESDINTLLTWYRNGALEGEAKDAPPAVKWPSPDDWEIGKPDYVYKMPEPFKVPKNGVLEYQFFRVPLNFEDDRWYQAVEVKPGSADVVHHVAIHVVPSSDKEYRGLTAMAELYGLNTQRGHVIADYIPGDTHNATIYDPNFAAKIPKHSDLVYEVHYTPNGRAAVLDQSMVAFKWAAKPPVTEIHGRVFRKPVGRFRIPPHDSHYCMEDSYYFESDVELDAIRPHFHLRGKTFRLEMVERNEDTGEIEKRTTILSVPRYDQRWQRTYELKTPLRIPAGTELLATAHFDNSSLNPNNPDPTMEVLWGQQTTDEMFSTRLRYRLLPSEHKVTSN